MGPGMWTFGKPQNVGAFCVTHDAISWCASAGTAMELCQDVFRPAWLIF